MAAKRDLRSICLRNPRALPCMHALRSNNQNLMWWKTNYFLMTLFKTNFFWINDSSTLFISFVNTILSLQYLGRKACSLILYHKHLEKHGGLRDCFVLVTITRLWHVAQRVSPTPPHHILPACLNLNGRKKSGCLNFFGEAFNRDL